MEQKINLAKATLARLHNLDQEFLQKKINVAHYEPLSAEIPDRYLIFDELPALEEIDEIWENFQPYLGEYNVYPLIGILGGNVIGIGISAQNSGYIYYYDFDFGIFELDKSIEDFLSKLEKVDLGMIDDL